MSLYNTGVYTYVGSSFKNTLNPLLFAKKEKTVHSVPNGMKSQTWTFFRLLRKIHFHQQSKGLIFIFYYQFNQVVVIKSEEITNISSKFNKNTVQSANPLDLILKIT